MGGGNELAEKVQSIETQLAMAHKALKEGELEDLHSQANKAKAEAG